MPFLPGWRRASCCTDLIIRPIVENTGRNPPYVSEYSHKVCRG
jgi:hypothetical protein